MRTTNLQFIYAGKSAPESALCRVLLGVLSLVGPPGQAVGYLLSYLGILQSFDSKYFGCSWRFGTTLEPR